jgi:hypothetical protein
MEMPAVAAAAEDNTDDCGEGEDDAADGEEDVAPSRAWAMSWTNCDRRRELG